MGYQHVKLVNKSARGEFIEKLLSDIEALEFMIENGMFEQNIRRIGAEQEFCLVDSDWSPSSAALEILEDINDPHFTTELGLFNLEVNLDPLVLKNGCFREMEMSLKKFMNAAEKAANKHDAKTLLAGILPTILKRHLTEDFMTPLPRYKALNDAIKSIRGRDFELHLSGVDELAIKHDSVLFEACNTSFQMHLQIDPEDFVQSYNWAQTIAGPVLALSANSPLLLGKELWSETRIALFQQSIDTRCTSNYLNEREPRVTFGNGWITHVTDIYKDDLARYKVLLSATLEEDSRKELEQGRVPKLRALNLHNGTIYRWNRPCYGRTEGKPHLRIENRYIPSGPTVLDEMANFAFWVGLMVGRPKSYDDMPGRMNFRDAKMNFINAARAGGSVRMHWMGRQLSASQLICEELLPIARNGLEMAGINTSDINRYLDVIAKRCHGTNGARWQVTNYRRLLQNEKREDALTHLTRGLYENQQKGKPVSEWGDLEVRALDLNRFVHHYMTTHLFTAHEYDLVSLVQNVMSWKNIHHMPVETENGDFAGLITATHLERCKDEIVDNPRITAGEIMVKALITITPDTPIEEAIRLMKENSIGSLPVLRGKELIGLLTTNDLHTYAIPDQVASA